MRRTFKYRIFPSRSQRSKLGNTFSMCRHLYNWSLDERKRAYEDENRSLTYLEQQNNLPQLKKERPWFASIYSLVLQDVLRRVDKAYQRFFDKKGGYPKYKKKGDWSSITYPDHRKLPCDGMLQVGKIGKIKIKYHREIPNEAKIKTLSITKDGGKWFVCFSVELPDPAELKKKPTSAIGIDLGLEYLVYDSEGECVEAPRFLRKRLKDLKRLQRKLSRIEKRTPKYKKVLKALQKAHYRIKCLRIDFFRKLANKLFAKADIVAHENLTISSMIKAPKEMGKKQSSGFNKSIYDASWGLFINILTNIAERLGKYAVGVDPAYTTQSCSECDSIAKKSLSTRIHNCLKCGYVTHRDHNSAKKVLRLGLESLGIALEAPTIMRSI